MDCLGAAVVTGKITKEESELVAIVADSEAQRISETGTISYEDAYELASNKAIDDFFDGKEIAKRQKVLQVKKTAEALNKMNSHEKGAATGLMSLLVNDITGKAGYSNVDTQTKVVQGIMHGRIADMLEHYRPKNAGFSTNTKAARKILLEVFGEKTGDQDAAKFAEVWKQVSEELRQRFNLAGGAIKKRKDWGMPQTHDAAVIKQAGYVAWREDITNMMDMPAMRSQLRDKIEHDIYGDASVKKTAREHKINLTEQWRDMGAREIELKSAMHNIDQVAANSPQTAREIAQEYKAVKAEKSRLKKELDSFKITKTKKFEDLPSAEQAKMKEKGEYILSRFDEDTESIIEGDLEVHFKKTYGAIVTDGLSELEVTGTQKQNGKLANRHSAAREFIFKDGNSWLAYHDKYGKGDVYGNMLRHIDTMSGEIAMLETLGPNPQQTFNYLRDTVKKDNPGMGGIKLKFLDQVFAVVSGDVHRAVSSNLANFMSGTRALLVSAKLGSAFLSSVSDLAFIRSTSAFNGMSSTKVMKRAFKMYNPKNTNDKKMAIRAGLIADAWVDKTKAGNRFTEVTGSADGGGVNAATRIIGKYADSMAKVSDITMRVSLLAPWTEANRHAFGMEFMGYLADNSSIVYKGLPKPLQKTFKRYGITENDWTVMRNAQLTDVDGSRFLRPEDLANADQLGVTTSERNELISKFMQMILTETDYAVPTPDARVQAMTTQGVERGTITGELVRSMTMFKSFPITMITRYAYRAISEHGAWDKGSYIASMFLYTTVMGGAAYQLKEMSKGRDPIDMNTSKFWMAAMMQGGGLGIFGDFIFSDQTRYGNVLGEMLLGPVGGMAGDVMKLSVGNVQTFVGKEGNLKQKWDAMNLSGDVIRATKNYMPGASLWYTRTAFERLVLEQAQMASDPQAKKKFNRLMKKRKKEYGQEYWWAPAGN